MKVPLGRIIRYNLLVLMIQLPLLFFSLYTVDYVNAGGMFSSPEPEPLTGFPKEIEEAVKEFAPYKAEPQGSVFFDISSRLLGKLNDGMEQSAAESSVIDDWIIGIEHGLSEKYTNSDARHRALAMIRWRISYLPSLRFFLKMGSLGVRYSIERILRGVLQKMDAQLKIIVCLDS